ncbi:MAG: hypothetical protein WC977_02465 [Anaerovoracaceae bacterium]
MNVSGTDVLVGERSVFHRRVDEFGFGDGVPVSRRSVLRGIWHALVDGASTSEAFGGSGVGVSFNTAKRYYWESRGLCGVFDDEVRAFNLRVRSVVAGGGVEPSVFDGDVVRRDPGGLEVFRREYLGFPTLPHHLPVHEAFEDPTNARTFVFGPPGMGKDTISGHAVLWFVGRDRSSRNAWMMRNTNMSRRRFTRIRPYLCEVGVYRDAPRVPGGVVPVRSMLEDFGPFKWEKGMVSSDGVPLERMRWTDNELFFVGTEPREADPNLWATGLDGALYGSRVDNFVLSDLFDTENSRSPVTRESSFDFVVGTLDSRLDASGRAWFLGTWLEGEHNYRNLVDHFTSGAFLVYSDSVYEKWSNGTAVVRIPAVTLDDDGVEESYWPDAFPMRDRYLLDGEVAYIDELGEDGVRDLVVRIRDGEWKDVKFQKGLITDRNRNPSKFLATHMQQDEECSFGDFTDDVLAVAADSGRSFGQFFPGEVLVHSVDPARTGGAGCLTLAVNPKSGVMTVVDMDFGERLGTTGIKQRLILSPLAQWVPSWLVYETNSESAVLDDPQVLDTCETYGVRIHRHRTGRNRANPDVGPASMVAEMRMGLIRFPAATVGDRKRLELLTTHLKSWDARTLTGGPGNRRTRSGQVGHNPDELAMALWFGVLKGREIVDRQRQPFTLVTKRVIPASVRAKYVHRKAADSRPVRATMPAMEVMTAEAVKTFYEKQT